MNHSFMLLLPLFSASFVTLQFLIFIKLGFPNLHEREQI